MQLSICPRSRTAFFAVFCSLFLSLPAFSKPEPDSKEAIAFVNKLLAQMTREEKVAQLTQVTANMAVTGPGQPPEFMKLIAQGRVGSVINSFSLEMMKKLQRLQLENSRLRIPLLFSGDIVNGYMTKFPTPLAESSSWDLPLIEKSARLAAVEAASIGLDWTYAPMVDIARDPRWGRVVEGAGEDPWWGAKVAAARVRGFQGNSLREEGTLMACAKHFAGYGAAIAGRDYNSVELTEREMREVYLPPFRAAVNEGVGTLMASFNDIAGVPSSANRWLLTKVLRKEWGFSGFVISDYSAIRELMNHGVAADERAAGFLAFRAGLDVDMEGYIYDQHLAGLVASRAISEAALDKSVRTVLLAKYKRGLFQNPYRHMVEGRSREVMMAPAHITQAREIAKRSIVLLKNDGVLPLERSGKIALVGPMAELTHGAPEDPEMRVQSESLLSSMREASRGGFELVHARGASYSHYGKLQDTRPDAELLNEALEVSKDARVILVSIGESPEMVGEAASRTQLRVPENQIALLQAMKATGKPVVLVLSNGRPLMLEKETALSNAVLETWFLGTMGGSAITAVLFGDYNPSGKLTVTFPRNEGQIPIYYAARNTGRPLSDDHWTSRYLDSPNSPLYPFGWGLSYTKFEYSNLELRGRDKNTLQVSFTVTNTGAREGEEVAQLYIRDPVASVSRPVQQLRGFEKVKLAPGESKRVTLFLFEDDLKFYDEEMNWAAEPGTFVVMVGGNSVEVIKKEFFLSRTSGKKWLVK